MADRGRTGRPGGDDSVTQTGREDSAAPGPGGGAGAGGPRPDQPGAATGGGGDPVRGNDDPGFFDITDADIPVLHAEPSDEGVIATADSAVAGDSVQSGGDDDPGFFDITDADIPVLHTRPADDGVIATADSAVAGDSGGGQAGDAMVADTDDTGGRPGAGVTELENEWTVTGGSSGAPDEAGVAMDDDGDFVRGDTGGGDGGDGGSEDSAYQKITWDADDRPGAQPGGSAQGDGGTPGAPGPGGTARGWDEPIEVPGSAAAPASDSLVVDSNVTGPTLTNDEEPSTLPDAGPGRAGGHAGPDPLPDIDDDLDGDDLPDDA
jgi:hypothetical protein